MLFEMPDSSTKKSLESNADHPTVPHISSGQTGDVTVMQNPVPYVPTHKTYSKYLKVFCGDSALALYWFNKQSVKE